MFITKGKLCNQCIIIIIISLHTSVSVNIKLFLQPVVVSTTDSVTCVRNFTTNVVRLKRFHVQEHHKYDILASKLCKLLLDSPSQEVLLSDVQRHFVSKFFPLIDKYSFQEQVQCSSIMHFSTSYFSRQHIQITSCKMCTYNFHSGVEQY